jgi:transcriptional regulator with XRE-family HTH domain
MRVPAPARLLRDARARAGLTQRELAARARTRQSVVARIESGASSPTWKTLERLLRAAGFDLQFTLEPRPVRNSHMLADVPRILRLTPEQRLLELRNGSRFLAAARRRG